MSNKIGYIIINNTINQYASGALQRKIQDLEENPPQRILDEQASIQQNKEAVKKIVESVFELETFKEYCENKGVYLETFIENYGKEDFFPYEPNKRFYAESLIQDYIDITWDLDWHLIDFVEAVNSFGALEEEILDDEKDIQRVKERELNQIKLDAEEKVKIALQEVIDEEGYDIVYNNTSMFTFIKKDIYDLSPKVLAKLS